MSFTIHLTQEALQEETDAYFFYEKQKDGLGERFLNEVKTYLGRVAENPTHNSYSDETRTIRDVALTIFPFVIIYEEKADRIVVYHIHHTSRELK